MNNLPTIFLSGGLSVALVSALLFVFRNWITIRLKSAIQHEYDEKAKAIDFAYEQKLKAIEHGYNEQLEKLRIQLQNDTSSTNTRLQAELEHDKNIFAKLNSYADETTVRDVVGVIGDNQFYDYKPYRKLRDLEHYGIQVENQFLNKPLHEAFLKFHNELDKFTTLVARDFFAVDGDRYMLYPELKNSDDAEERKIHEDARIESRDASRKVLEAYGSFRKQVQQELFL